MQLIINAAHISNHCNVNTTISSISKQCIDIWKERRMHVKEIGISNDSYFQLNDYDHADICINTRLAFRADPFNLFLLDCGLCPNYLFKWLILLCNRLRHYYSICESCNRYLGSKYNNPMGAAKLQLFHFWAKIGDMQLVWVCMRHACTEESFK